MPAKTIRFCDESELGFGWIAEQPELLQRASHALCSDGRVWLVDPVDGPGLEERVRALGEPAGVVQLVDRHDRDCAALAARLGVPHHRLPFAGLPGSPFEVRTVLSVPGWREAVLWWEAGRVLVCMEALGRGMTEFSSIQWYLECLYKCIPSYLNGWLKVEDLRGASDCYTFQRAFLFGIACLIGADIAY